jgi:hypothetical protein
MYIQFRSGPSIGHGCTPIIFANEIEVSRKYIVSGLYIHVLLGSEVLRLAQQQEREGAGIPGGCLSPAKGWAKT